MLRGFLRRGDLSLWYARRARDYVGRLLRRSSKKVKEDPNMTTQKEEMMKPEKSDEKDIGQQAKGKWKMTPSGMICDLTEEGGTHRDAWVARLS